MSQETIVTNYTSLATGDAQVLVADCLAYNRALSNVLYDVATLDAEHLEQVRAVPLTDLLQLRQRLEILINVVRLAISGNYL